MKDSSFDSLQAQPSCENLDHDHVTETAEDENNSAVAAAVVPRCHPSIPFFGDCRSALDGGARSPCGASDDHKAHNDLIGFSATDDCGTTTTTTPSCSMDLSRSNDFYDDETLLRRRLWWNNNHNSSSHNSSNLRPDQASSRRRSSYFGSPTSGTFFQHQSSHYGDQAEALKRLVDCVATQNYQTEDSSVLDSPGAAAERVLRDRRSDLTENDCSGMNNR